MLIPTCIIKLIELMLTVACLTLHHYSYDLTDVPTLMLCTGTYVGYVIVLSGEIIGEMIFAPLDLVQDMYFGILGVGLFSVCGGLVLSARTKAVPYPRTGDYNVAIVVGSLGILNALVMLFDLSLAYLDSEAVSATPDPFVEAWWSAAGGALFGACGALTLTWWRGVAPSPRKGNAHAAAICSLITACLLLIDTMIAFCTGHRDDRSTKSKCNM